MDVKNPYLQIQYSGRLALGPPFPCETVGLLGLDQENSDEILRREQDARLPDLFAHFGIAPDSLDAWESLARALASRHVPGFAWQPRLPIHTSAVGSNLGFAPWPSISGSAHLMLKRGRGRPKRRLGGGLLGLLEPTKEKRPAHRPPTYTLAKKALLVRRFDEWHKKACKAARKNIPHREFAELFDEPKKLLRLYYRFKSELARSEKSDKIDDTFRILTSFGSGS